MMQELIVAMIVAYATWAVSKRYAPKALRAWARSTTANAARRAGFAVLADRLQNAPAPSSSSCSDGCDTCNNCSTTGSAKPDAKTGAQSISVEQLRRTISR
jgi:hypothetical protein